MWVFKAEIKLWEKIYKNFLYSVQAGTAKEVNSNVKYLTFVKKENEIGGLFCKKKRAYGQDLLFMRN